MTTGDVFEFTLDEDSEKRLHDLLTDMDTRNTDRFWIKDKHGYHAEYVKVRHGKWDKGTDSYWHICEKCGAEVDISMGTGVWVEGVELYELKYCPNCGAKMESENETD